MGDYFPRRVVLRKYRRDLASFHQEVADPKALYPRRKQIFLELKNRRVRQREAVHWGRLLPRWHR
jgi:hypothetical protein